MSHTKGLLTVDDQEHGAFGHVIRSEHGVELAVLRPVRLFHFDENHDITSTTISEEESKANARRLVACWNTCDGIPTEQIAARLLDAKACERERAYWERMVESENYEIAKELADTTKQCDELKTRYDAAHSELVRMTDQLAACRDVANDMRKNNDTEIARLRKIDVFAKNLVAMKGRYNTEAAYKALAEALEAAP